MTSCRVDSGHNFAGLVRVVTHLLGVREKDTFVACRQGSDHEFAF